MEIRIRKYGPSGQDASVPESLRKVQATLAEAMDDYPYVTNSVEFFANGDVWVMELP